jgi:hypothetical protein
MFKDIFGKTVSLGDSVAYAAKVRYGEGLRIGRVVKVTTALSWHGQPFTNVTVEAELPDRIFSRRLGKAVMKKKKITISAERKFIRVEVPVMEEVVG